MKINKTILIYSAILSFFSFYLSIYHINKLSIIFFIPISPVAAYSMAVNYVLFGKFLEIEFYSFFIGLLVYWYFIILAVIKYRNNYKKKNNNKMKKWKGYK